MIVLDVSFAMKLLTREVSIEQFDDSESFIAPDLFDYEISNVLWKLSKFNGLAVQDAKNFLEAIDILEIVKEKSDPLKLLECSIETGLTAYDAAYFTLAKEHNCPLATIDQKLIEVAQSRNLEIIPAK